MVQRQNHISFIAYNNIFPLDLIGTKKQCLPSFLSLRHQHVMKPFKISMMVISPFKDEKYDLRVPEAVTK